MRTAYGGSRSSPGSSSIELERYLGPGGANRAYMRTAYGGSQSSTGSLSTGSSSLNLGRYLDPGPGRGLVNPAYDGSVASTYLTPIRRLPELPPIRRLAELPPTRRLPELPPGRLKRVGKTVLGGLKKIPEAAATMLPAAVVGGVVGGAVSRAIFERPDQLPRPIDNTRYEVRGEGQQRVLDSINTEPPTKKVRFNEELDFSKPSEEARRPSRFATRTREPGNYDFSTPSRGATRQFDPRG